MESQCIVFKNKWTMYDEKVLSLKYLVCFFSSRSIYVNCSCDNLKMNNAKINWNNWYVKTILYLKYETGKRVRARDITYMEYSNKAVIGQTIKGK